MEEFPLSFIELKEKTGKELYFESKESENKWKFTDNETLDDYIIDERGNILEIIPCKIPGLSKLNQGILSYKDLPKKNKKSSGKYISQSSSYSLYLSDNELFFPNLGKLSLQKKESLEEIYDSYEGENKVSFEIFKEISEYVSGLKEVYYLENNKYLYKIKSGITEILHRKLINNKPSYINYFEAESILENYDLDKEFILGMLHIKDYDRYIKKFLKIIYNYIEDYDKTLEFFKDYVENYENYKYLVIKVFTKEEKENILSLYL